MYADIFFLYFTVSRAILFCLAFGLLLLALFFDGKLFISRYVGCCLWCDRACFDAATAVLLALTVDGAGGWCAVVGRVKEQLRVCLASRQRCCWRAAVCSTGCGNRFMACHTMVLEGRFCRYPSHCARIRFAAKNSIVCDGMGCSAWPLFACRVTPFVPSCAC
ncbi:hypothetical protein AVEN_162148-1 [Araneus ventricosus]|uniref:Uncharacterized protein n=1 Tax=Araneus ventricosus TaxID=182803 RepID=A0A4Y2J2X0_ARAVE|nr:hypothetical protein AVEN_162148-1 [Araneus ventricosus]